MSIETAKALLGAIVAYNKVKDGDSGDAERDAGGDLQAMAISHLQAEAARNVDLAELVDSYRETLNHDPEMETQCPVCTAYCATASLDKCPACGRQACGVQ